MIGLFFYYGYVPNLNVIYVPLLIMILIMTSLGTGLILSAMAVQYRDVKHAMYFLVRILMYSVPVVYSINIIPEQFQLLYSINPMVGVIEGMRAAFLGTRPMPWEMIGVALIIASFLLLFGALYFRKMEKNFADIA